MIGVRKDKVKALVFQARETLIADRAARMTPCAEVREEIATARGGGAAARGPAPPPARLRGVQRLPRRDHAPAQVARADPSRRPERGAQGGLASVDRRRWRRCGGRRRGRGRWRFRRVAGGSAATKMLAAVAAISAVAGGAVAIDLRDGSGPSAAEGATGAPHSGLSVLLSKPVNGSLRASLPLLARRPGAAGAGGVGGVGAEKSRRSPAARARSRPRAAARTRHEHDEPRWLEGKGKDGAR